MADKLDESLSSDEMGSQLDQHLSMTQSIASAMV